MMTWLVSTFIVIWKKIEIAWFLNVLIFIKTFNNLGVVEYLRNMYFFVCKFIEGEIVTQDMPDVKTWSSWQSVLAKVTILLLMHTVSKNSYQGRSSSWVGVMGYILCPKVRLKKKKKKKISLFLTILIHPHSIVNSGSTPLGELRN